MSFNHSDGSCHVQDENVAPVKVQLRDDKPQGFQVARIAKARKLYECGWGCGGFYSKDHVRHHPCPARKEAYQKWVSELLAAGKTPPQVYLDEANGILTSYSCTIKNKTKSSTMNKDYKSNNHNQWDKSTLENALESNNEQEGKQFLIHKFMQSLTTKN